MIRQRAHCAPHTIRGETTHACVFNPALPLPPPRAFPSPQGMGGADLPTIQRLSTCTPWTEQVSTPDPFFFTLAALHWGGARGPKIGLAAEDPADTLKVEAMRAWISENWFPRTELASIPCVDVEALSTGASRRRREEQKKLDYGTYTHCADEYGVCTCARTPTRRLWRRGTRETPPARPHSHGWRVLAVVPGGSTAH